MGRTPSHSVVFKDIPSLSPSPDLFRAISSVLVKFVLLVFLFVLSVLHFFFPTRALSDTLPSLFLSLLFFSFFSAFLVFGKPSAFV
ncbi:hypothetical protein DFJ73DRAFT_818929 [Zopfochytrium polystomum]|nr:hypothetical protein DFJ73DRAFT_818929 [Zopfochytrium polystomum]